MENLPLKEIETKIATHTNNLKSLSVQSKNDFKILLNNCIEGNELLNYYFVNYDPLEVSANNLKIIHDQIAELLNIVHLLRKQEEQMENPTLTPLWDMLARIFSQSHDETTKTFIQKIYNDENREMKQRFTSAIEEALQKLISARKSINLSRTLMKDNKLSKDDADQFLSSLDVCMKNLRLSIQYLEGSKLLFDAMS